MEVIPGKPSDNKKDEANVDTETGGTDGNSEVTDKDSTSGTGSGTTENTGTQGESTTGNTGTQEGNTNVNTAENAGTSENTGGTGTTGITEGNGDTTENSGEQSGETIEQGEESTTEQEETESSVEKNYDYFYDEETGKFNVTFNIKDDANGDQTVELSKVLEEIRAAGKSEFENWFATQDGRKTYDEAMLWEDESLEKTFNGIKYVYYLSSGDVNIYTEPGCTTVFDVYITNGSNHTYVYKDQSFTVATPDMTNDENTGVTGFDGQELPEKYSETKLSLGYNKDPDDENAMNHLVDEALEENPVIMTKGYYVNADGNMTTDIIGNQTFIKGTPLVKIGNLCYIKGNDCYYGRFPCTNAYVETKNVNGTITYVLKKDTKVYSVSAYNKNGNWIHEEIQLSDRCDSGLKPNDVKSKVNEYMQAHNYTYESYILEYYNNRDNTQYQTIDELVQNNEKALKELAYHTVDLGYNIQTEVPVKYNNFYKNVLSFNVGDSDKMQKFLEDYKTNEKDGHDDGYWSYAGTNLTIGDYMADKLNKTDGAWEKANEYFNALTASGITKEEATWAAFTMATNIDAKIGYNGYQNTEWSWYSSLVLKQQDGTLNLTKVDTENNQLGDDEGEGQTSFYLWKVDKKTETGEDGSQTTTDVTKYCVYVDPVYETVKNNDGSESQKLVKDGYYGWVEYDPENKELNYTISTTNGTLNIDYTLLEGVVYYLQEKAAPDGYDVDSKIYVICDESAYKQMTEEQGIDSVVNQATGVESATAYLGEIKGAETLKVNFVNGKTVVVPDSDPDPEPEPTPNPTPDNGGNNGGNNGSNGGSGGGSHSSSKKSTTEKSTEDESGSVLGVERESEESQEAGKDVEQPGQVLGAERLPKTGDNGADASVAMFGVGLLAALYAWISGKREKYKLK